jgi:E3 ubiquitin-protein ligase UHRF1
VKIYSLS